MPHRPAKTKHRKVQPPPAVDSDLARHLRALGLESVDDYRAWCRERGFRTDTRKGWHERRDERLAARKSASDANATAELLAHLEALGLATVEEYGAWCREHGFSDTLRKGPRQRREERQAVREAFLSLLLHCERWTELLSTEPAIAALGWAGGNSYLEGLLALARHHGEWLRPLEAWQPDTHNRRRQFGSLARHLLTRYFVPAFLDAAWFRGACNEAERQQGWFKHVGSGQNIRTADVPLALTKRMAHYFLQAPDDFSIEAALRWAQVRGMEGDDGLARAVIRTRLGATFENEAFWATVVRFFVNNPMLDPACVGPMVEYLHAHKFVPREPVPGEEPGEGRPPLPELEMKGRTAVALLRLVEEWQERRAREARKVPREWARATVQELDHLEEAFGCPVRRWTIRQLLSSSALYEEGRAMNHCVGSYAGSCGKGAVTIWSLEVEELDSGARRRVLTISVRSDSGIITQALGKNNVSTRGREPDTRLGRARRVLQLWARREGLTLPGHA